MNVTKYNADLFIYHPYTVSRIMVTIGDSNIDFSFQLYQRV